ncbi:MAG: hypothetical protein K6B14_04310 [Lachnospiraceae bacterium]|nr:hypothetical protein [Lachnospiraceae bacterium]
MKAKYFLKGMGIGVTVTAIIFTVAFALQPPTLSDEEVIARAKMLGMVESDETLLNQKDMKEDETEADASDETASEETASDETASEDAGEATSEETIDGGELSEEDKEALAALKEIEDAERAGSSDAADNSGYKTTDTVNDSSSSDNDTGAMKSFSIKEGEDSAVVSSRLYRQGIIDDPNAFDDYLTSHGYDTRIHPGSYNIPSGSSFEAIANAIAH